MPDKTIQTPPELVCKWTVTAFPPLLPTEYPTSETLSEVDEWLTQSSHWLGFSLRFDALLDPEVVKEGLAKTLHHIPALGARVVTNNTNPSFTEEDKAKNPHDLYQLALLPLTGDGECNQQGAALEYFKGTAPDTVLAKDLPNETHTRQVWKEAGLDAPGPGYSGAATLKDSLLRAKLVVYEQQKVSYLCIGINHGLGDGSSICDMLQIWSHFCYPDATVKTLPEHLASRRTLGNRVTEPEKPAKDTNALFERMESEIKMTHNPFRLWTLLLRVVPRAIWAMSRAEEVELRVSASRLAALKKSIVSSSHMDKSKDNWASSFEVLCASVLLTEWATLDSTVPAQHNLHVCCDLRGRSKRFSKGYFGNAAFDFCEPMSTTGLSDTDVQYTLETLVALTQHLHTALRQGLADAEPNACKAKDWFEAARHLGLKNKYNIWAPVALDVLRGDGTFVNSWDKRWLDCSMGAGKKAKASSMVAWFGTLQNMFVEVPRHSETGDSTIYLALPSSHAKRFRAFCEQKKETSGGGTLPFDIIS